jgi:hypothetical protein
MGSPKIPEDQITTLVQHDPLEALAIVSNRLRGLGHAAAIFLETGATPTQMAPLLRVLREQLVIAGAVLTHYCEPGWADTPKERVEAIAEHFTEAQYLCGHMAAMIQRAAGRTSH